MRLSNKEHYVNRLQNIADGTAEGKKYLHHAASHKDLLLKDLYLF